MIDIDKLETIYQADNIFLLEKLVIALTALDKIRDPRLRHSEPDKYTELGCVMNIADLAVNEIIGDL